MDVFGWILVIVLSIVVLLLLYWAFRKEKVVEKPTAPAVEKVASVKVAEDDLVIIEGIGPKIASILKANGISTFAGLAATDVAKLEQILREHKLQFAKPDSWPKQAKLAAEGKMDELKALQEKLVAGR